MNYLTKPFTLAVIGGVVMGLAFLPFVPGLIVIPGLTLTLMGIERAGTYRGAFLNGLTAGGIKTFILGSWVWSVYPLVLVSGFAPSLQLLTIFLVLIGTCIALGSGLGIIALIIHGMKRWPRIMYLSVPPLLILGEIIGSAMFSLFALNPESSINTHFSFGYVGYPLISHGLLGELARFGGVYTLSFTAGVLALMLVLAFQAWRSRILQTRKKLLVTGAIGFLIATYPLALSPHTTPGTLTVAAVGTSFGTPLDLSTSMPVERTNLLFDALDKALESGSDVIVFPEGSGALRLFVRSSDAFSYISERTKKPVILIDSDQTLGKNGDNVRANIYDTRTKEVHRVYKNYLVPIGEFLPWTLTTGILLVGKEDVVDTLKGRLAYVPNEEAQNALPPNLPGVLLCSESVSPVGVRLASRRGGAPLIVHPISHGWFHTPTILWHELDHMLRTQVKSVGVPLVQAGNMAPNRAYNQYGVPVEGEVYYQTASTTVTVYRL